MKNTFLKKIVSLLEKEVCQNDKIPLDKKYPIAKLGNFPSDKPTLSPIKTIPTPKPQKETLLSEGVVVKGELNFTSTLRIQGTFEGHLNTKGTVIVDTTGSVKGGIEVDEAYISGTVVGNISVKKLTVSSTATITGDIKAETISIDQGANFSGYLEVCKPLSFEKSPKAFDKILEPPVHCMG